MFEVRGAATSLGAFASESVLGEEHAAASAASVKATADRARLLRMM
jgi:hypothetical protein